MKKAKLLFPLLALLCICIPLGACKKDESGKNPELEEHFAISKETKSYSSVQRYEGKAIAFDTENKFVALKTTRYNAYDRIVDTVNILNVETGEVIHTDEVSNNINAIDDAKDTINIKFEYPAFVVEINRPSQNNGYYQDNYSYEYYLLTKDTEYFSDRVRAVRIGSGEYNALSSNKRGSLYLVETQEKSLWINEKFEIIREFQRGQTQGYSKPRIQAGYKNYLYAWDTAQSNYIQVYNAEGIVCMQYTFPSNVDMLIAGPYILNNGNILVQEATYLEPTATDYTLKLEAPTGFEKVDVETKVIDYKTGKATVIDCDFIVTNLSSAYNGKASFPFELASGMENQAYIVNIVNKQISMQEYVVLDNNASVVYSFPTQGIQEKQVGIVYSTLEVLSTKYLLAEISNSYADSIYGILDMFGNIALELPVSFNPQYEGCGIGKDYYVTKYGIYDLDQNLLYDLNDCEILCNDRLDTEVSVLFTNNQLFIIEEDIVNNVITMYSFNVESKEFEKIGDTNSEIRMVNNRLPSGNYVTVTGYSDEYADSYTWTLYNSDGDAFLRLQVSNPSNVLTYGNGFAYTQTVIDGTPYIYIIK